MRAAPTIHLTADEQGVLRRLTRHAAGRVGRRARIVLQAAQGHTNRQIATALGTDVHTVARWRSRVAEFGISILQFDASRSGRRRTKRDIQSPRIVALTQQLRRRKMPCSTRIVARTLGVSPMLVQRVWKDAGIG